LTLITAATRSFATLTMATSQLLFYATWIVYAALLPGLAAVAGLPAEWVAPILLIDQVLFFVSDPLLAWLGDRGLARWARAAPAIVLATAASSLCFVAMAVLAPLGPGGLLAPLVAWALLSGVLRAPVYALFHRHLPARTHPFGLAGATVGVGLAQASAAWIGPLLAGVAPLLPFVAVSAGVCFATLTLAVAERALPAPVLEPRAPWGGRRVAAIGALLVAASAVAAAVQIHAALRAPALWKAAVAAKMLPYVTPIFWVAFTGACGVWALAGRWIAPERLLVVSALPLAVGLAGSALGLGRWVLGASEAIAGFGWAGAFVCGLGAAATLAPAHARGVVLAGWFSTITLATMVRMGIKLIDAVPAEVLDGGAVALVVVGGVVALVAAVAAPRP
jgi:hypothetical protein